MRSLTLKLIVAFLIIGLTGAGLVAVLVGQLTQRQFDEFVDDRYQTDLVNELADYYTTAGNWDDLEAVFVNNQPPSSPGSQPNHYRPSWRPMTVVDANNVVVVGAGPYHRGDKVDENVVKSALPITVDDKVVGQLLLADYPSRDDLFAGSPEAIFIAGLRRAIVLSGVGALSLIHI